MKDKDDENRCDRCKKRLPHLVPFALLDRTRTQYYCAPCADLQTLLKRGQILPNNALFQRARELLLAASYVVHTRRYEKLSMQRAITKLQHTTNAIRISLGMEPVGRPKHESDPELTDEDPTENVPLKPAQ